MILVKTKPDICNLSQVKCKDYDGCMMAQENINTDCFILLAYQYYI